MPVDSPVCPDHAKLLLGWYDANARRLPWRSPPGDAAPDPYRVWLSEVMLQQTTVASATGYFNAFTLRWPNVQLLANAEDSDVMRAWAGLGYYARARNLLACARIIATEHDGVFPDTEADLLRLPGIGRYTAAALAAIAYSKPATVVDGNVERVVARLFAEATPMPAAKSRLHALAARLTPQLRPGDYAQAMMDLGATVCTPRSPRCTVCPVSASCAGRLDDPTRFPVKTAKPQRPIRHGIVYWLEHSGAVFVVQRPPRGLLGGMRALPTSEWVPGAPQPAPPIVALWRPLSGVVRHVFTHFELHLTISVAQVTARPDTALERGGEWVPLANIVSAGLPSVFAKAARHVLASRHEHAPDRLAKNEGS